MDQIKQKIFRQSVIVALVIGALITATTIPPLYIKLSQQQNQEVKHILKNRTLIVESVFAQMSETANQFTSRSIIRDKLVEYNSHQISLEELKAFATPLLQDALNKSAIALGARRIGVDGSALIEIGKRLPPTNSDLKNEIEILELTSREFVARAPIHSKMGEVVGYDELLFDAKTLEKIINDYSELYQTGEVVLLQFENGKPVAFFDTRSDYKLPLQKSIRHNTVFEDDVFAMSATKLFANGFWLLVRIPKDELTAPIKHYIFNIFLASLFVAMLAIPLAMWLVNPLIVRLTEEFKRREKIEDALRELNSNLERTVEEEIVKRREHEHILVHQARVVQMGELINSIAHQWRQPLNALALTIQDIKDAKNHKELSDEYISQITADSMKLINSMSRTIDDFRSFYKTDRSKMEMDLVDLINGTIKLLKAQNRISNIALDLHARSDEIIFNGYKNELVQFVQIIINNAIDAIEEKQISDPIIAITLSKDSGKVVISIEDNAGGIDPMIEDRIFDPYFTTKDQGKGVGLELYIAKIIIEEHMGGSLGYMRTENGAKFIATLPCAE